MKNITVNNIEYIVVEDSKDAIDIEVLKEKITDYFDAFNYIVGDWSYGKIRLKGFYDDNNKKAINSNKIGQVKNYLKNYCAFGCKYFILKKKD